MHRSACCKPFFRFFFRPEEVAEEESASGAIYVAPSAEHAAVG
jgi:hypothetical protein